MTIQIDFLRLIHVNPQAIEFDTRWAYSVAVAIFRERQRKISLKRLGDEAGVSWEKARDVARFLVGAGLAQSGEKNGFILLDPSGNPDVYFRKSEDNSLPWYQRLAYTRCPRPVEKSKAVIRVSRQAAAVAGILLQPGKDEKDARFILGLDRRTVNGAVAFLKEHRIIGDKKVNLLPLPGLWETYDDAVTQPKPRRNKKPSHSPAGNVESVVAPDEIEIAQPITTPDENTPEPDVIEDLPENLVPDATDGKWPETICHAGQLAVILAHGAYESEENDREPFVNKGEVIRRRLLIDCEFSHGQVCRLLDAAPGSGLNLSDLTTDLLAGWDRSKFKTLWGLFRKRFEAKGIDLNHPDYLSPETMAYYLEFARVNTAGVDRWRAGLKGDRKTA